MEASLTGLSAECPISMQCSSLITCTLRDQVSEGGIGVEHVRDLHSVLFPAMTRHSLKFTESPLHF
jgi:hypothetical protein